MMINCLQQLWTTNQASQSSKWGLQGFTSSHLPQPQGRHFPLPPSRKTFSQQIWPESAGPPAPLSSLLYLPPPSFLNFMPLFLSSPPFFPQMTYFAFSSQSFSMFSSYRWDLQYKLVEDDDQPSMLLITSMFGSCWLFYPDSILGFFHLLWSLISSW